MKLEKQLETLSPEELEKVIELAHKQREAKQREMRQEVIREIKKLAASAGLEVSIRLKGRAVAEERGGRRGGRLPPKYRHPADPSLVWTGRGQMPRWMRELVEQGHDREEFRIKD